MTDRNYSRGMLSLYYEDIAYVFVQPQVLFQRQSLERWFSKVTEDPTVNLQDVQEGLIPDRTLLTISQIVNAKKFAKTYVFPCIIYVYNVGMHDNIILISKLCNVIHIMYNIICNPHILYL